MVKVNVGLSCSEVEELKERIKRTQVKFLLDKWQSAIPQLKAEKILAENEARQKVERFRTQRYGKLLFECLRLEGKERKIESEKDQFKQAMWSKVNNWLSEIDQKQV